MGRPVEGADAFHPDGVPRRREADPVPVPLWRERGCPKCDRVTRHRRFYSPIWGAFWGQCWTCGWESPEA